MHRVIRPDNLQHTVTAFFTGKVPGSDVEVIASIAGIGKTQIYFPLQQHTDKVLILRASLEPKIADAVVTNEKGILIGVQVADCVPLLLFDKKRKVAGAVHAGWRGTASAILKKTIEVMKSSFLCKPEDIMVAIGPSIRGCCYTVGHDVSEAVTRVTGGISYHRRQGGQHCIDLAVANRDQALSMDISESNIWVSEECTYCNPDSFFSYRYAKGSTGRQTAVIGIF